MCRARDLRTVQDDETHKQFSLYLRFHTFAYNGLALLLLLLSLEYLMHISPKRDSCCCIQIQIGLCDYRLAAKINIIMSRARRRFVHFLGSLGMH